MKKSFIISMLCMFVVSLTASAMSEVGPPIKSNDNLYEKVVASQGTAIELTSIEAISFSFNEPVSANLEYLKLPTIVGVTVFETVKIHYPDVLTPHNIYLRNTSNKPPS